MRADFQLHERLAADTLPLDRWPLCEVLLAKDATYPWLILVPRRVGLRDFDDLAREDLDTASWEIVRASRTLKAVFRPDKLNVAALGNQVPQLHVHVIARFTDDPAWPGPIWGGAWSRREATGRPRSRPAARSCAKLSHAIRRDEHRPRYRARGRRGLSSATSGVGLRRGGSVRSLNGYKIPFSVSTARPR
jgi:diadenosine tetraphosphate (Ap4A) HIT family hydrolase